MGIYLNCGSGQRPFQKPFINIDKQARWNPDILCDFGNPLDKLPFEEGTVDMIVLHHVLEHYNCGKADNMLQECKRLLRSGGTLLVFVPDMVELTHMWWEGRLTDQVYMTNIYGAYMGDEADIHRWGYTRASLKSLLQSVGFRLVGPFDFRSIDGADIAKDRWILGLEAIKWTLPRN